MIVLLLGITLISILIAVPVPIWAAWRPVGLLSERHPLPHVARNPALQARRTSIGEAIDAMALQVKRVVHAQRDGHRAAPGLSMKRHAEE